MYQILSNLLTVYFLLLDRHAKCCYVNVNVSTIIMFSFYIYFRY